MSVWKLAIGVLLVGAVATAAPLVWAGDLNSPSFTVNDSIVTVGGGLSTSASFQYIGATGQTVAGSATSTTYRTNDGALYYPVASSPVVSVTAGTTSVSIGWTASTATFATVTEYQYGIAPASTGVYTYTANGTARTATASGLTSGTAYLVKVRVYSGTLLLIESDAVPVTTTGTTPTPPPSSGGGASGGGGGAIPPPASTGVTLEFSGRAYPNMTVTLMQDARIVGTTQADANAYFTLSVPDLTAGTYTFSMYGEDYEGVRSSLHTFAVTVNEGENASIGSIYIPPTIAIADTHLTKGESVTILGQTAPQSTVTITVHSDTEYAMQAVADDNGVYLYSFDTTPLEPGEHTAKSRSMTDAEMSGFSRAVAFDVSEEETSVAEWMPADANEDGVVNLVDFSIAAYWYNRTLSDAAKVMEARHFNGDGAITIVDMSIIAYYWSGTL